MLPDLPLDDSGRPDLSALADAVDQSSAGVEGSLTACAAVIVANGALDLSAVSGIGRGGPGPAADVLGLHAVAGSGRLSRPAARFRRHHATRFRSPSIPADDPELATAAEACALAVGARPPA